jgi:hypothetical protein
VATAGDVDGQIISGAKENATEEEMEPNELYN